MKLASSILFVTLTACATNEAPSTSKQSAARVLQIAAQQLDAAERRASDGNLAPDIDATVNFTSPCGTGLVTVTGSYEANDDGTSSKFDVDASFDKCGANADGVLDGDISWKATQNGDAFTASSAGSLVWTDSLGVATCAFDFTIEVNATSAKYSGTICGHDADELDLDIDDLGIGDD
jgi:hypothetical protein